MTDVSSHHTAVTCANGLPARLKADTAATHERMHVLMGQLDPFCSRERYARFVMAQLLFQRRVHALCATAPVDAVVADLSARARDDAAAADLADLSEVLPDGWMQWMEKPATDVATEHADAPGRQALPAALGWLYVSEGSTLGAAFLFKAAQANLGLSADFGARNLAAPIEGRSAVWRRFVDSLAHSDLSEDECDKVVAGAHEAFAFYARTLMTVFGDMDVAKPKQDTSVS